MTFVEGVGGGGGGWRWSGGWGGGYNTAMSLGQVVINATELSRCCCDTGRRNVTDICHRNVTMSQVVTMSLTSAVTKSLCHP